MLTSRRASVEWNRPVRRTDDPRPAAATPDGHAETDRTRELGGMANVAALTFLVARAVPLGWTVGVAAGVPLARAAQCHGARAGYATATASLVETTAIMGPARMGIPVPHAISAPLVGVLDSRGRAFLVLAAAAAAVRTAFYAATSTFSIVVLIGLDAYLGTYDRARDAVSFLPAGTAAALLLTFASLVAWSGAAGLIQAWVIRRGLSRWEDEAVAAAAGSPTAPAAAPAPRPHAGAMVLGAVVGFVAALASTDVRALAAIAIVLGVAWALGPADGRSVLRGVAIAAPLALSTLGFGLVGGIGSDAALRRSARVALLVLIAVWVRSAAGSEGLRRVSLLAVARLRRVRMLAETAAVLGAATPVDDLPASGRRLVGRLRAVRRRPVPVVDAALGWVAEESVRLGAAVPAPSPTAPPPDAG